MIINFANLGGGGGGGYVLPTATDSRLGGVKVGSGLSIDSGGTLTSEGKPAIYINDMSQAELAAFYADILPYSGTSDLVKILEKYDVIYYIEKGPASDRDFFKLSNVGFYRNVFRFRGEDVVYDSAYRGIFEPVILIKLNADGTYTSNIDYYGKTLLVNANGSTHSLSFDKDTFENYPGRIAEANVPVSLRLVEEKVTTTKCNLEVSGNDSYLYAEWTDNSGVTYEAKWIFANNETPVYFREKSAGGPTIVNLDALSQAELTALYEQLSGETSASTVNEDYIFLKNFSALHGGNKVPFRVQFLGYFSYKVRFGYCKPDNGHSGEIWLLFVDVKDNGVMETSMTPSYGYQGLKNCNFEDAFIYNVDTGVFSAGATIIESGATYSGIFNKSDFDGILEGNTDGLNNQIKRSFYKLNVTGSTTNESYATPMLSKKAVAQTVIDGQTFDTRYFFDYGEYVLSFLVNTSGYKALPQIKYRANVVQISQSDYDALVAGGTVDPKTIYVII